MHSYSINSNERRNWTVALALVSIPIAMLLHRALQISWANVPWWMPGPSVLGVLALLEMWFIRFGWKTGFLRKYGLVKTPNLGGHWTGFLTTSFDDHATKREVSVNIIQTWINVSIQLRTSTSESESVAASVSLSDSGNKIIYHYRNVPRAGAANTMQIHEGTAVLTVRENSMRGQYYSGRGRENNGDLELTALRPPVDVRG